MSSTLTLHFLEHLIELRRRLVYCCLALMVVFAGLFYFSDQLYHQLALPLIRHLPRGQHLIATHVAAPLTVPLELAFSAAIILLIPYLLYHLWAFVAPGLYHSERYYVWPLLCASVLLFYAGMAFAYFIVFPIMFGFFARVLPTGVALMPDMSQYLNFVIKLLLSFGFAFQVPVVTVFFVCSGLISLANLVALRPYIIIAAFVIGMLLTPPDVISQIMLALPMWFLFEVGVCVCRFFLRPRQLWQSVSER